MQPASLPVIKDIVLIGGGHAHVTVLKRFAMKPVPGVRLTLISPDAHTPYSGMLPGLIAGHYTYDEAHIDLAPLCRMAAARFLVTEVAHVDPVTRFVHCDGRPPLPYDILSINAGSTLDPVEVAGAGGRVIPVKPVARFLDLWQALKDRVLADPERSIGVVGAGAGGVELALSAQYAVQQMLAGVGEPRRPTFHIITQGDEILATHNARVRTLFGDILRRRDISLHTAFCVDRVSDAGVHAGPRTIQLDDILWVTGASAAPWLAQSGFDTDDQGFLVVDPTLRSVSHADVFGAGDIAAVVGYPRPKSGVFAVRQGPPLHANLRRAALARPPRAFRPQSAFLSLISTGDRHAVASRGRWCLAGDWVWRWKDRIDRNFMEKFNDLPEMDPDAASGRPPRLPAVFDTAELRDELGPQDMRCGGCGAKVGATTLSNVLAGLDVPDRADVVAGLAAPDDAALIAPPAERLIVQTVDSFRSMVDDPYIFAKIAANHCLGDIYAMGAAPQSAMAIVTVPAGLPAKTEALLGQLMAGATEVLGDAGCALVGGHTGEGLELSLGFSLTGLVAADRVTHKSGLRPGDALLLTKPLGTGTLFAADMRARAKGRWLQAAIATALQSNRQAAEVLHRHGATACTDVTGFGLIGHLAEMLDASADGTAALTANLDVTALPAITGALDTLAAGIFSSLQAENLRRRDVVGHSPLPPDDPQYQLLFDPQTAGGLLAGVPAAAAAACCQELRRAGYRDATVIGHVAAADAGHGVLVALDQPSLPVLEAIG